MVLIDSETWIGFLGGSDEDVDNVRELIEERSRAVLCGVVLQEVLSGVRPEERRALVRQRLAALPFLEAGPEHFALAGALQARDRGAQAPLSPSAALLASHAMLDDVRLLTRDPALHRLAEDGSIRLYRP